MRPRVVRHLIDQIQDLTLELRNLPDHAILSSGYIQARQMMWDQINLAMKHQMRAGIYHNRANNPEATHLRPEMDVEVNRKNAAESWWGFRRAVRKAHLYLSFARILLAFDQDHITQGEGS